MSDNPELNKKGLTALRAALKAEKIPKAYVGILKSSARTDSGKSNAEIGKKHEFGEITVINGHAIKLPERSFLRFPLADKMQQYLDKAGFWDANFVAQLIKQKSLLKLVQKIGILGERIVLDGFDSGGFGKWKPSNMRFKKNAQTLVETQQLRNSITSEVK